MAEEFENKEVQSEQNENSRDGYSAAEQGGYQREYRGTGRTQRPRIHSQRAYSSDKANSSNDEGGFRPEGFGSGLQSAGRPQQGGYRPRYNNDENGYQPQAYRPRYNANNGAEGEEKTSYQANQGGYQPRQGGYQPRQQGGYQSRGGYNNNRGG